MLKHTMLRKAEEGEENTLSQKRGRQKGKKKKKNRERAIDVAKRGDMAGVFVPSPRSMKFGSHKTISNPVDLQLKYQSGAIDGHVEGKV